MKPSLVKPDLPPLFDHEGSELFLVARSLVIFFSTLSVDQPYRGFGQQASRRARYVLSAVAALGMRRPRHRAAARDRLLEHLAQCSALVYELADLGALPRDAVNFARRLMARIIDLSATFPEFALEALESPPYATDEGSAPTATAPGQTTLGTPAGFEVEERARTLRSDRGGDSPASVTMTNVPSTHAGDMDPEVDVAGAQTTLDIRRPEPEARTPDLAGDSAWVIDAKYSPTGR
jgi:hypothetical protein